MVAISSTSEIGPLAFPCQIKKPCILRLEQRCCLVVINICCKIQTMNTLVIVFDFMLLNYYYDYLEQTLSQAQQIVWCGYDVDKPLSHDNAQQSCVKVVDKLNEGFFVLCVNRVPKFAMREVVANANLQHRLWVFVSEQPSMDFYRDMYSRYVHDYANIQFLHYSDANVRHLKTHNLTTNSTHFLLPFLPCTTEYFANLRTREKKYDIAFVGNESPYRTLIIDKLRAKYRLVNIKQFGKDRDLLVAESKVLINVHYTEYYETFESLRCVPALLSGTLVVSENSTTQTLTALEKQVRFAAYDDLVAAVEDTLTHYEETHGALRTFLFDYAPTRFAHCVEGFDLTKLQEIK